MKYYSLHHKSPPVSFKEAVIRGIAPDRGLYYPSEIAALSDSFFGEIEQLSDAEIAYQAMSQFTAGDIPDKKLYEIVEDVLQFDFPLVPITDKIAALELFHGPTLAFKDVALQDLGWLKLWTPDILTLDWRVVALAIVSGYLLLVRHWGIASVLGVASALALVIKFAGI